MDTINIQSYLAQLGNRKDPQTGAVSAPIYLSTAYGHPGLGQSTGYDYTRTGNPTRDILQEGLAVLENGVQGFATSSGMSAIQLAFSIFPANSHFVASRDLYGGSFRYFQDMERKGFYSFTYVDDPLDIAAAIQDNTAAVYIETPTNPLMKETDIAAVAEIAKKHGLLVIVDNTFYTPLLQRPLDLGADIVVHSATKYLGGHNDLLAGAVVTNDKALGEQLAFQLNTAGGTLDAFDCWLLVRGLKTLPLRMKQHQTNAQAVVAYLESEDLIKSVHYPGKGGMLSFTLHDKACIPAVLDALNIFTFAESLGGVESLITYPTTQTHADIPVEVRESYGLTDDLLRISTGIEDADDLIADLRQAFAKAAVVAKV
ncbi:cystathionine gamma-synthase [Trichococcus patagoniensis]|uniref:Cystathionine gamma-synthase n=2 Tax=Trichococcus patagoniensis TaxID=382641 RepID=A0A2T5IHG0_9LACT|nr:cystathionine gamma-synthase [Trichococcus patagoniensis]